MITSDIGGNDIQVIEITWSPNCPFVPGSPDRGRGLWDDLHITSQPSLPHGHVSRDAVAMPERAFPAVDALIRRVQRAAASRPDPMHILAQTISMTGEIGADPYAVLGVLIEGAAQAIAQHIPAEHQMGAAAMVVQLLEERLNLNPAVRTHSIITAVILTALA